MKSQSLECVHDPAGREEKWQKHVIAVLWIFLALFVVLSATLWYAETHGMFHSAPGRNLPSTPWPNDGGS